MHKHWKLAGFDLQLEPCEHGVRLRQQNYEADLLFSLAKAGVEGISECSLELIFKYGDECDDLSDALRAYSEKPLKNPPDELLLECYSTDWGRDSLYEDENKCIILSGSEKESDFRLVSKIISCANSCFRHAALLTMSSFRCREAAEILASLLMTSSRKQLFGEGELHDLVFCFQRFLRNNVIEECQLKLLLEQFKTANSDSVDSDDFVRIVCGRTVEFLVS